MRIYVSGSIYGGRQKIETYKKIINALEKYGDVLDKQIVDEDTFKKVKLLMNELGIDENYLDVIAPALEKSKKDKVPVISMKIGKKIIAVYDLNVIDKVSTMIRGNKRINLIGYHDISEITDRLDELLEQ